MRSVSTRNFTLPLASMPLASLPRLTPHLALSRQSAHSNPSNNITRNFEKSLNEEINYEKSLLTDLPTIQGFKTSLKGLEATFTKESKEERISVSVHANEKIEPEIFSDPNADDGKSIENFDDESDGEQFAYLPLIYIDITKPNGSKLKLDCSFNPEAESLQSILESGLQINSARIIPDKTKDVEDCFSLEGTHFDDKLYDHMVDYLESKGMGVDFLNELIQFYQVFEHQIYLKEFLIKLSNFIKA